ncbi:uncharacterized protein LOC103577980 [Microplitis demolitor]|uniref:uncharacterized protein LOC103577980 n=1 Tax=Microplitis demolitor TaxID=69319 RepID=UPI0006D4F526|nr:uncharacterized protein LOC103577980 [Microplitis demolitor]XP_014299776.1 uncharacterized protein LOC103577980 [Microplitis demolitor]XP_014299778.1 uncharacterized protein LOC103577980 [Microplitis demolitor]XP_014299780.1 uncharacterized protein LOC103577980 [Microplitis demolitor]XP_053596823.1 uncharacterized protein LOC103577980 [Microplitis demolitor]
MPRCGKTHPTAGQSTNNGVGLTPQLHQDYHRCDVEWSEQEAIDAEVSQLVNGGAAALHNLKRWRNSTSSGYSSHSPPLSAGSYSTCCASVLRNSAVGTLGAEATLGLAVIHEAEAIPRPIWPCSSIYRRDLHLVGCETLDCEGLSASCSYARAYTYASRCRNAWQDCQPSAHTAQDVLFELSRTLNSVTDGESDMTPEEILRDISRTVQKGIETNGTTSTGISSEEHIYRLSSSSSSVIGKDSVTVNPVNLKLYSKPGYANPSVPSFKTSYQCLHEGKTLLLKSVAKSQEKHRKHEQCNKIPAIFLVPHCNSIHTAHTVSNYNTKSVENTNDKDDNRLIKIRDNLQDIEHNKMVPRIEHTQDKICYNSDEPVYSTQLDLSDESSSYGAVRNSSHKANWNQGINVFNKSLDFTLDGHRAERLGRLIARAKRRRQWCRALTTILGLVFFILSVVVVSMSVTKGRKIFGSM